jgi:hypothetical protein
MVSVAGDVPLCLDESSACAFHFRAGDRERCAGCIGKNTQDGREKEIGSKVFFFRERAEWILIVCGSGFCFFLR